MDIHLPLHILPSYLLYGLLVGLLLKPGPSIPQSLIWGLCTALLGVSYLNALLNWQGMVIILVAVALASQLNSPHKIIKHLAWTTVFVAPLLLALHLMPGFTSTTLFGPSQLGNSRLPYTLNANLDKAIGGLMILVCFRYWLNVSFNPNINTKLLAQISIAIIALFAFAYLLGVRFDPKFGQLSLAFIFFNLFVTCVAEESFFRLLIQRYLYLKSNSPVLAVLGSTLLFTLAHFHTGPGAPERLTLIFVAGLIYAWTYQRTQSVLAAITCHFIVNFIHLSLFVYPATFS